MKNGWSISICSLLIIIHHWEKIKFKSRRCLTVFPICRCTKFSSECWINTNGGTRRYSLCLRLDQGYLSPFCDPCCQSLEWPTLCVVCTALAYQAHHIIHPQVSRPKHFEYVQIGFVHRMVSDPLSAFRSTRISVMLLIRHGKYIVFDPSLKLVVKLEALPKLFTESNYIIQEQ